MPSPPPLEQCVLLPEEGHGPMPLILFGEGVWGIAAGQQGEQSGPIIVFIMNE